MPETGKHTSIVVGRASADVKLVKMSAAPKEPKHETRRIDPVPVKWEGGEQIGTTTEVKMDPHPEADHTAVEPGDPFGDEEFHADESPVRPPEVAPKPVYEHGITREGVWVDLTAELAEVDRRTTIDGMTIECTVDLGHLPRTWTRDAYYIVPTSPESRKFLGYLWSGLMPTSSAAIVRFQKRTNQFLGAIIARGFAKNPTLVLVELEWAQNVRDIVGNAALDLDEVPEDGRLKAREAMKALRRPVSHLENLRDERSYQRAEVLEAARKAKPIPTFTKPQIADAQEELGDAIMASTVA